jgi:hypothetical protein
MIKVALIYFVSLSTSYAFDIVVKDDQGHFSLKTTKNSFYFKGVSFDYSFKVNKCNKRFIDGLEDSYRLSKKKFRLPASVGSKNSFVVNDHSIKQIVRRSSHLGHFLKSLPGQVFKLSLKNESLCKK